MKDSAETSMARSSLEGPGRRRLAILAATVAAFLLVPAAQAFANEHLKVNVEGSGKGKVIISPALEHYKGSPEINCSYASPGPATGVCTTEMSDEGEGFEQVFVEGVAEPGSRFAGWTIQHGAFEGCAAPPNLENHSGCAPYVEPSGSGEDNSEITAIFECVEECEHELTVTKAGTGSGTVTCDGGACASKYLTGTKVTLTATASAGSNFSGFSGGGCAGTGNCVVTLNADTAVTATFNTQTKGPPAPGTATAAATAKVKNAKASLKLSCSGGPCSGSFTLKAKIKQGKKTKNVIIGKASFSLADGASGTITVKVTNGQAKKLLSQGKSLKTQLKGTGVQSRTVTLKPAKASKKH
jgi:hypothetical protein